MLKDLIQKISTLPIWAHISGLVLSGVGFVGVKGLLDASYLASRHPVDYATGQLAFDGQVIKGFYAHMIEAGTLGVYWQTQLIDFGFIAALLCLGLFLGTFIARFALDGSFARKLGILASVLIMGGTAFDVAENLTSFVLLANPGDFSDWIAFPYSGFAAIKFMLLTSGMLVVILSVLFNVGERLLRAFRGLQRSPV